jgi:2-iminobutanoate/2-iminopropanoate deaminase
MKRASLAALAAVLALGTALSAQDRQQPFNLNPGPENQVGYTAAVRVGNVLYLSGAGGGGATLEEQMTSAYASIAQTLQHYGATLSDVVRETVYTTDMAALQRSIPVRKRIYGDRFPAATWVQIDRLFLESMQIEIEVTAVIGSAPSPAQ